MPLFWKPYVSDVTAFIDELKAQRPTLEAEQRAGRALLWDRVQDARRAAEFRAAKVRASAYQYFGQKAPPTRAPSPVVGAPAPQPAAEPPQTTA